MANPWFRMYSDFIYNETVEFLSFEDQRHFIFLLCMKNEGILDKHYPQPGMLERVVGRRLGLIGEALDNAKRRIMEVGLINVDWQPVNWDERQFKSDTSKERTRAYRDRLKRHSDVTVTTQDTDTDTDTDIPAKTNVLPISSKPEKRKTAISPDFCVTPEIRDWALKKGINNIDDHLEPFISTCRAKGYKYVDWHSAFQNAVRDDWARIGHGAQRQRKFVPA